METIPLTVNSQKACGRKGREPVQDAWKQREKPRLGAKRNLS